MQSLYYCRCDSNCSSGYKEINRMLGAFGSFQTVVQRREHISYARVAVSLIGFPPGRASCCHRHRSSLRFRVATENNVCSAPAQPFCSLPPDHRCDAQKGKGTARSKISSTVHALPSRAKRAKTQQSPAMPWREFLFFPSCLAHF